MSAFALSQLLAAIAISFDLLSFQFKERKRIIACLIVSCLLIACHFVLLGHWTAAGLGALAAARFVASYLTSSKKVMAVFVSLSLVITLTTFHGVLSVLSGLGSIAGTIGTFCQHDKQLRQIMMLATSLWLVHNCLAGTPTGMVMEALFIGSNLTGYYRYYWRRSPQPCLSGCSSPQRPCDP